MAGGTRRTKATGDVKFDYAVVDFFDTWTYSEGSEGSMAIVRLHSRTEGVRWMALFTQSLRQQSALETAFITKAKISFSLEDEDSVSSGARAEREDRLGELRRNGFLADAESRCGAPFVAARTVRAIYMPVCM